MTKQSIENQSNYIAKQSETKLTKPFDTKKFTTFLASAIVATGLNPDFVSAKTLSRIGNETQQTSINNAEAKAINQPTTQEIQALKALISESNASIEGQTGVSLELDLSEHRLTVKKGTESVVNFPIGVGAKKLPGSNKDWTTPTGEYTILMKTVNPNPKNPQKSLKKCKIGGPTGCYFMEFKEEISEDGKYLDIFGIHGTKDPNSVGIDSSHGCIRMLPQHVELIFKLVKLGTKVSIKN